MDVVLDTTDADRVGFGVSLLGMPPYPGVSQRSSNFSAAAVSTQMLLARSTSPGSETYELILT